MKDICARRHMGSAESIAANVAVHENKSELRRRVLAYVRFVGASTCEEVSGALDIPYQTVSARCSELKAEGFLVKTGDRRQTTSGCSAAVLRATTEAERERSRQLELRIA